MSIKNIIYFFSFTISLISCSNIEKYVVNVDVICKEFDKNKSLNEVEFAVGLSDGKTDKILSQRKVITSKDIKDLKKIEESNISNYNYKNEFYYKKNRVIKSIITITSNQHSKVKNFNSKTKYYYKNNKCLKKVNENEKLSNCEETRQSANLLFASYPASK